MILLNSKILKILIQDINYGSTPFAEQLAFFSNKVYYYGTLGLIFQAICTSRFYGRSAMKADFWPI